MFALPTADADAAGAIAQGALLGAYAYTVYQQTSNGRTPLAEIALAGAKPRDRAFKAAADRAIALAEEVNRARDLINMPPNDLHPREFAAVVTAAPRSTVSRSRSWTRRRSPRAATAASWASARARRTRRGW